MVAVPTPLHLAASLLALAAGLGLAVLVLEGDLAGVDDRGSERSVRLPAVLGGAGAGLFAVAHALNGAFLASPELIAWLQAAGLAGVALGVSPPRMRALAGPPVLVPVLPVQAALAGGVAGAVAGLRVLTAGASTAVAGVGLLALAAAQALQPAAPTVSATLTVVGSLALGTWLWRASARRVLAKLITAFVASLVVLTVLIAAVLSSFGTSELVADELDRLQRFSEQLAAQVEGWPPEAAAAATAFGALAQSDLTVFLTPLGAADAARVYSTGFREQDYFAVLAPSGAPINQHPPELGADVLSALAADPAIAAVRNGQAAEGGGLVAAGGRLVAFGAVRIDGPGARPEDLPRGVLLTGRFLDEVWAAQQASRLGVQLAVEIGGEVAVTSPDVTVSPDVLAAALDEGDRGEVRGQDVPLFVGTAPVVDPETQAVVARIASIDDSGVIAAVERGQARRLYLVALLGALLAGVVASLFTGRLVAPIRTLTRAAEQVGQGRLDVQTDVGTVDEIGQLGLSFNAMTASLQAQRAQLSEAATVQSRLRARLEALTQSMSDGLVAVDTTGRIIAFNRAAERLTGLDAEAVTGRPMTAVLAGRTVEDAPLQTILAEPHSTKGGAMRLLLARPGGGWTPVAVTASPVRDEGGGVLGRVYVLRDVTREAEIERMKTEFLSNVSHELRTPLTPIKGYANILARRDVPQETRQDFAEEILSAVERLERVVSMIVDFAALDSGRLELDREPVDLADLVSETLADWGRVHTRRTFAQKLNGGLPAVLVDRAMLRRCLDELLDNAVKFSPGGEPVEVQARREGDRRLRVSVTDHGVGLAPEVAAQVFSDFYQVDATETRHFGGLGLGLALVRRIVNGMGGEAEVDTRPGDGATFHLLLPIAGNARPQTFVQVPRPGA